MDDAAEGSRQPPVLTVSLCCGGGPSSYQWGLAQWSTRIIRLLLHSGAVTSKVLLEDLLGPRQYHRLDPVMRHDPIPFDACHRVGELVDMAEETDLAETIDFVQRQWGAAPPKQAEQRESKSSGCKQQQVGGGKEEAKKRWTPTPMEMAA